jgi:ABC-2 type transport system permease protein
MTELAGWRQLVRLVVRRDRVRLSVWIIAIVALVAFNAQSIFDLYDSEFALAAYATTVDANAALVAMSGPARGLDTYGGRIAWESWVYGIAIALMAVFTVVRHTRTDEEAGRTELIRSTAVGRHAHAAAALTVAVGAGTAIGALTTAVMIGLDLPVVGSVLLGASFTGVACVFAGVGMVAAQVTPHGRAATGLGAAVVALSFALRAVGDVTAPALSWASPIGWMQSTQPFSGDRTSPLVVMAVASGVLVLVAARLERRRDLGAGLVSPSPGPAVASPALATAFGLSRRLHRATLWSWSIGMLLGGAAFGSIAHAADDLVGDNQAILDYLAQVGGATLAEIFLATIITYLALLAAAYGIAATHRLHGEESDGHAEVILATATSRRTWTVSHMVQALTGSAAVLAAAAVGLGIAYSITTGDALDTLRVLGAAAVYLPAVWVVVGVAFAVYGGAPRWSTGLWAWFALCTVIAIFGDAFELPRWLQDLSPFEHPGLAPAMSPQWPALVVLGMTAGTGIGVGLWCFGRRDVSTQQV